jgi:amidohydrolase
MEIDLSGIARVRPAIRALQDEMVNLRRDFHAHPEPGFAEHRTAGRIAAWLEGCGGLRIRTGVAGTGVVADLAGSQPAGPWVLLRADMDALRIEEDHPGLSFRSRNPGVMHACGHDAHMAILLAVTRVLTAQRERLRGGVRLIFQPAEEGPGGAGPMIAAGVLAEPRPAAAFGLHVWSGLPTGWAAVTPGPIMAYTDEFYARVRGRGGHGAVPQETVDPILASAHLVTALQSIVSRNVGPLDPAVVSVGKIRGGSVMNAIAEEVALDGTLRAFLPEVRERIHDRLRRIFAGLDQTFGTRSELEIVERYPALVNDPGMTQVAREVCTDLLGAARVRDDLRVMGGEDMAFYLQQVPGCFVFLGAGNPAKGTDLPHHNPKFDLDEDALGLGAEMLVRLVERVQESD